ncbi:hypothetical protein [Planosporangium mesophilum]|uniref:hypothetical protein n=1 Tax=Planosporangium mesophilum TaxID=689768 RepID=UPI0019511807|nr:hypothetical protein [Planosporangium mesophilum]
MRDQFSSAPTGERSQSRFCPVSEVNEMSQQSVGAPEADRQERERAVLGDQDRDGRAGDDTVVDEVAVDDPGSDTGQVLGQSVPIRRHVAEAVPGSPETGAVYTEEGRPSAEKPYT